MLKALLKKQFLELNTFYFQNRKTGKNRSKGGTVAFVLLFVLVFLCVAVMFFGFAAQLAPLADLGQGWLYFAMMGMMALLFGVFGSVFNTYAGLFRAKDNELLLSMPIPPRRILMVRLVGVYAMGLLYESLVMLPAILAYWLYGPAFSLPTLLLQLLLTLVLGLLVLTMTCALGWVVALIAGRLRNKSFITVLASLVFLGLYYVVCFRINSFLQSLLLQADAIGSAIRSWAYPIFALGAGAAGQPVHALAFLAICAVLFALCCLVMSRSFLRIATTQRGEKKAVYTERRLRTSGQRGALLRKELCRFKGSATYMLNCGLGLVMLLAAGVFLLIKQGAARELLAGLSQELSLSGDVVLVGAFVALTFLCGMVCITTPSVSLEGKSIWLLQSMPVAPWAALRAKLELQLVLATIPTLFAVATLLVTIQAEAVGWLLMLLLTLLMLPLSASLGLFLNLKKPNLTWTNEVIPIKQGAPVMLYMFGFWGVALVIGGGYYLLYRILSGQVYLLLWVLLLALANAGLLAWLKKRGSAIFAAL